MKLIVVTGARPNFMKVAPIMEAFRLCQRTRADLSILLLHTGQHNDQNMSSCFFKDLHMPEPDINLEVGSGSHAEQTARIMVSFERVCLDHQPDWVIVVGDVNSTMACAITAKKLGIKVAHVEAGLRSRDMTMPEEINRLCTDAIADLHFTTDVISTENLRLEGIHGSKIHFVGNTMIDSLLRFVADARSGPLPEGLPGHGFAVLTLHRPANVDTPSKLAGILDAVRDISNVVPIVFPVHPRTLGRLKEFGLLAGLAAHRNVHLTEPLSYLPFLGLVSRSKLVLTDSGGIQEETTVLGIPCLTLRSNTERPITCEVGTNVLVGSDPHAIRHAAFAALNEGPRNTQIPQKWDGRAAERIVAILLNSSREESLGVAGMPNQPHHIPEKPDTLEIPTLQERHVSPALLPRSL